MDYDLNCTMLGELLEFEVEVDVFFHQNVDGHILTAVTGFLNTM